MSKTKKNGKPYTIIYEVDMIIREHEKDIFKLAGKHNIKLEKPEEFHLGLIVATGIEKEHKQFFNALKGKIGKWFKKNGQ